MLPRWHILLGALFSLILFIFLPNISPVFIILFFLSSFLIDFDHYATSVLKSKKFLNLWDSFGYHKMKYIEQQKEKKKGIKKKGDFHLFHTLEFHVLIGLLGLIWLGFFYIFLGMVFHSLLDLFSLTYAGVIYRREFFLFNWFKKSKVFN